MYQQRFQKKIEREESLDQDKYTNILRGFDSLINIQMPIKCDLLRKNIHALREKLDNDDRINGKI